ncbi:MAG: SlyX family protein [Oceanococcaceae bacterium]
MERDNDHALMARLAELECRLAFQDDTVQRLNDIVAQQQDTIDHLKTQLRAVARSMVSIQDGMAGLGAAADDEPPPHY